MGLLIVLGLVAVGFYFFNEYRKDPDRVHIRDNGHSSLDIAKERYARGEISRNEFERIRNDLS